MKNLIESFTKLMQFLCVMFLPTLLFAQSQSVAIFSIDGKGINLTPEEITTLTRIETQKFDGYYVIDKYDLEHKLKENNLNALNCFSTDCLIKAGELVKADLVITGSISTLNNNIVVNFRLLNIAKKEVTSAIVREFANISMQTQNQIQLTLAQLLNKPLDTNLYNKLKRDESVEEQLIQPNVKQLNLSGPRMGFAFIYGENADILKSGKQDGGFNMNPVMFQIGYQFEKQYLNSGKYQALIEFLPMISGIDQNKFIPSFSLIHGLRNNQKGWEFGLGAVFSLIREKDMFVYNGKYYVLDEWKTVLPANSTEPTNIEKRLNSGGDPTFNTGVVIAVGKSFRSGSLNIPVAIFVIPQKGSGRVGISVGFNSKK